MRQKLHNSEFNIPELLTNPGYLSKSATKFLEYFLLFPQMIRRMPIDIRRRLQVTTTARISCFRSEEDFVVTERSSSVLLVTVPRCDRTIFDGEATPT